MIRTFFSAVAIAFVVTIASSQQVHAGATVYVGSQVAPGQQVSMDQIDHSAWDAILREYVDDRGMVAYRALHAAADDVRALDGYLRTLSTANPRIRASHDGQLAFWINAYNGVTVRGILREYPTTSIRNHSAKVFGYNIWKDLQLYVGGQPYSLEQIEHETLRKMGEPRIHFAIVCASHSCPRLRNEAYTAAKLQQQLTTNTRDFFANQENFRYANGTFYLSSILKWFAEDFGSTQAEQLRAISPYLPDRTSQQAAASGSGRISFLGYDWSLNDQ